jgi:hypothetical protein
MKILNDGHQLKFPIQKRAIFRQVKQIKGLRLPPGGLEQEIPKIYPPLAD